MALGALLAPHYDLAFCSGLRRTQDTLLLALESSDTTVDRIHVDPRLNERSMGVLELKPSRPIPEYRRGEVDYAPVGGESYRLLTARLMDFMCELATLVEATKATTVLLSTHMGPLRMLTGVLEGERDAASVMARQYRNTELVAIHWQDLARPRFL